jgi:hypothetical protein
MIPQRVPRNSFSARCATSASVSGEIGTCARCASASVIATVKEAEEESPAPIGISPAIASRVGGILWPRSCSTASAPRRRFCQRNRLARLPHVDRHRLDIPCALAFGTGADGDHGLAVDRAGQDKAIVVIDMLTDQVDPSRRGDEAARFAPLVPEGEAIALPGAGNQPVAPVHRGLSGGTHGFSSPASR